MKKGAAILPPTKAGGSLAVKICMYNMEWLNINGNRRYPFREDSTMFDSSRRYELPNSIFVDALIGVPVDFQYNFYVSRIQHSPVLLSITISTQEGIEALVGTIQNPDIEQSNIVLNLDGKEKFLGAYGRLIIGALNNLPEGDFEYLQQDLALEPCRIIKTSLGVTSLNGIASGNIVLKSSSNVVITPRPDDNVIVIDTFDGLCACDNCPTIKTFNGQKPVNNNINIQGIGCITVVPGNNGIDIRNECEDACCGCDEVNDMVDRISDLQRRITILEGII